MSSFSPLCAISRRHRPFTPAARRARDALGRLAQFLRGVTRKHQLASFRDMSQIINAGADLVRTVPLAGSPILLSPSGRALRCILGRAQPRRGLKTEPAMPPAGGKG